MNLPTRGARLGGAVAALLTVLMVGTAAGAQAPARHPASASGKPVYGGTLSLDTQTPPAKLDIAQESDVVSQQFLYLVYNTLVSYAPTSAAIVPSLATGWTHNAKGTVWTFSLRRGVKFSNGDPFNANAVAYTLTRLNEGVTNAPYQFSFAVIAGSTQVLNATKTAPWPTNRYISGVRILNPYKIQITLTAPERFFLNVLALPEASIEDPSAASKYFAQEKAGKQIQPVGTGPFVMQPAGASASTYVFKKNAHYWVKGLPYLNEVQIHIGPGPELQFQQFQKGTIQAMPPFLENFGVAPAQYLAILKNPTLRKEYFIAPDIGFNYLSFNIQAKPWNNLQVREAVAYALNKSFLDRVLYNGRAKAANSILPPAMPGYQANLNPFPVNDNSPASLAKAQAKARTLLKQAGYPHGVNGGTFWIISGPGDAQQASIVKTEMAAVGIQVTPRIIGFNTFLTYGRAKPDKLNFYSLGWTQDYPDPQDFLFNLLDGSEVGQNNFTYVNNPTVNRLLATADSSVNQAARLKLYDQVQTMAVKNAWLIPFAFDYQDGLLAPNAYPKNPLIWAHPVQPAELDRVWLAK